MNGDNYAYDGRGGIAAVSGGASASYAHDAEGRRVEGDVGGMVKQYVYGIGGQGLTITDGSGNLMSGETYFGGRHLGTQTPSGFVYAYTDGLGSEHVLSNGEKDTNWPFGEFPNFQNGVSPAHFTGKPYDSETGLDYFGARYYAPSLGRFMTPDWSASPAPVPYANLQNPQSLNLYSYVLNNPATDTDPDGHWCILGWGNTCSKAKEPPKEGGVAAAGALEAAADAGALQADAIFAGAIVKAGAAAKSMVTDSPLGLLLGATLFQTGGDPAGLALQQSAVQKKLGGLAGRAGEKVRDVIRSRGGTASNVNEAGPWADRTLGETAQAAVEGDRSAEKAVKIAKTAGRLGQNH